MKRLKQPVNRGRRQLRRAVEASVDVPLQLFLDLVWLQAFYALQLNGYDGGGRRAVKLDARLKRLLTDRELQPRKEVREAGQQA